MKRARFTEAYRPAPPPPTNPAEHPLVLRVQRLTRLIEVIDSDKLADAISDLAAAIRGKNPPGPPPVTHTGV